MLAEIKLGAKTLLLKSPENGNIFDIDSLSLVIGPNGSGKTMMLKKLVDYFTGQFNENISPEIEVINTDGTPIESAKALEEWGVVYYSSLLYPPKFNASPNFIDASPKRRNASLLSEIVKSRSRIERFGFTPDTYITTQLSIEKVLMKIIRTLIGARDSIGVVFPNDPNFTNLHNLYSSKTISPRDIFQTGCLARLEHYLMALPKRDLIISVLVVIDRIASIRGATGEIINLCNRLLKIPYEYDRGSKGVYRHLREIFAIRRIVKSAECRLTTDRNNLSTIFIFKKISSGKEISPDDRRWTDIYFELHLDGMSSGQIAILLQFCNLTAALEKISKKRRKVLLLIDEGDAFLHLEWQRIYIQQLNDLLAVSAKSAELSALQVIMATHSPLLATDIPKQFICSLNSRDSSEPPKAFAATLHTIFNHSFNARTIGEFASQRINEAVISLQNQNLTLRDKLVIQSIDNPIIRREIKLLLNQTESEK